METPKLKMTCEIIIVPFFGQGHLFPCIELCKHLSSRNYKITLLISSNISSSIPSSLRHSPLIQISEIPSFPPPPPSSGSDPHHHGLHQHMALGMEGLLAEKLECPVSTRPVLAVVDVMMSWSKEIFKKFGVPTVGLFTSGACSAAIEYATWKADTEGMKPGEIRLLPGLPDEMCLTYSDINRRHHGPPHHRGGDGGGPPGGPGFPLPPGGPGLPPGGPPGGPGFFRPPGGPPGAGSGPMLGPPGPGQLPPWVNEVEGSIAVLINTCDDLERQFIDYVANQTGKPVWGVGPLLPEQYWRSAGPLIHDREVRPKRESNCTEDEVIQWLDTKPSGSVIYVAFGTEVGPELDEYVQLAEALEETNRAFIWVLQSGSGRSGPPRPLIGGKPGSDAEEEGYFPDGLDSRVGKRGLIIRGWAPQLLILSHPSTGGFLTHCGWNSTVEAIGRGVPLLAWPIRGDQHFNAKLVVDHLKVGYMVSTGDSSEMVKKDDIVEGIERLMADEEVGKRAATLRTKFEHGFPASSLASLDAFSDFINQKVT